MQLTALFLPIVLPVAFWVGYHYHKDRHLPEPPSHLLVAFLLGVAAFYLGSFAYQALERVGLRQDAYVLAVNDPLALFTYAILVIGVIEEAVKMLPFMLVIIHFREFDEPIDGIIYASFIAIGFATMENLRYLEYASDTEALARGFAGPVVHIVFASVWGYYIGRAWLCRRAIVRTIVITLAGTATLHGIYDFAVIAEPAMALPAAALLIVALWIWRLRLIDKLHALPPGPCPDDD